MIVKYYIAFNEGRDRIPFVKELLRRVQCEDGLRDERVPFPGPYGQTFDSNDPRLERLREVLRNAAIEWRERREHTYTVSELRRATLLYMSVSRSERDAGEHAYREQFDLSTACSECGTGAKQVAPLIVKSRALPKKGLVFATLNREYLFAEDVAISLLAARLTGLEMLQARSGKKKIPWWQFMARYEMPPFAPETRGLERSVSDPPCARCNRDGYFYNNQEPIQLIYRRNQLGGDPLPDVAHTYECQGCSVLREPFQESQFAKPMFLIGSRVFDILQRHKVKGLSFEPVAILEN